MLRSATTVRDLAHDLNKSLGPDVHRPVPDGVPQHSVERTATTIGAGAGMGKAIGGMTRNPIGVLIGAMIGGAGGLILDQILNIAKKLIPSPRMRRYRKLAGVTQGLQPRN